MQRYDESAHARAIAHHLGTQHTELQVTEAEAQAVIPELPEYYDEPFADSSQIPTMLVSRLARQQVTVCLSGDGGDEVFGGYERYFAVERIVRIPSLCIRLLSSFITGSAGAVLGRADRLPPCVSPLHRQCPPNWSPSARCMTPLYLY